MADEIKKKVLIVDDDKFLLDMYTVKFNENGFEVIPALGSLDALNKIKEGVNPDIMLLDIVMPTMDGFELLEVIKRDKLAPNSKAVILSNLGQQSDIDRGRTLGADGYIVKANATPSEVVAKVKEIVGV